ncbi:MAG TPA: methyltransferase [Vicinamibacterales bacterium]|nr:methyltransferase [Vicinamibacterales bacterium]
MQYGAIPTSIAERIALAAGLVPIPILDTVFAMMKARCLMAGVRLGVFEALQQESRTPESLATALRLDASCLELLLRSLVYCHYLVVDGDRFALSSLGRATMVEGAAKDLTGFVQWNYTQWEFAGHLESLVRTGEGLDFHSTLNDSEAWGYYQKAMLEAARFDAPVLAKHVPVRRGATRLLDLAGSHGLMGAALCRKHPPMRSTVIDLPAAVDHARALAEREGITGLVDHRPGDLLHENLGTDWDVTLLSNILHHFKPGDIAQVLARVHAALTPSGTVAIWEIERPNQEAKPSEGDGVALFFRLTSSASAYSGEEYAGWLANAGFRQVKVRRPRLRPGTVLLHARR